MRHLKKLYHSVLLISILGYGISAHAQETPKEEDFFKIMKVATQKGLSWKLADLLVFQMVILEFQPAGEIFSLLKIQRAADLILENCFRYA
jgi:hypothetical protein